MILDVGANIGNHTLYWNKNVKTLQQIHSFEPLHETFQLLTKNVENNKLDKTVLVRKCVGKEKSKAIVERINPKNMGGTVFGYATENDSNVVDVIDLDSYVEESGVKRVDFIKIDTEGFELDVSHGAKHLIETYKPTIWVESWEDNGEKVVSFLLEHGYEVQKRCNCIGFYIYNGT